MSSTSRKVWSAYFLIICVSTLIYFEPAFNITDGKDIQSEEKSNNNERDYIVFEDYPTNNPIKETFVPGNFKTKGFFSYNQYVNPAEVGETGVEWVEYDDTGYTGNSLINARFVIGNHPGVYYNYPSADNTYTMLREYWSVESNVYSNFFTPEMANDTTISGKVHYLVDIHRDTDYGTPNYDSIDITLRITLSHHFKGNSSSNVISSIEYYIPKLNTTAEVDYVMAKTLSDTIPEHSIPAGDRLKVTYEIKYSNIAAEGGHITFQSMRDNAWQGVDYPDPGLTWTINDGVYSNIYSFTNLDAIFGFQVYMREEIYPDVFIYNVEENSVYQTAEEITIDVTDGTDSYYKWDSGSWVPFSNYVTTTIPTIHGWHTLTVSASESIYNNTQVKNRTVGYDASVDNIQLHNAITGEKLPGGFILNFSFYDVDSVNYTWDGDPTPTILTSPYDITAPSFNGLHYLTINTSDFYETQIYNYQFYFDSDSPLIDTYNIANYSFVVSGKAITFQITDYSNISTLQYQWDGGSVQNWANDPSNLYSTTMPIGEGNHSITITAIDEFGHSNITTFVYYTSIFVFTVDLKYWDDGSYHYGGEDVEFIIQQSNTTLYYSWNGGMETKVLVATSLVLSGVDALPTVEGRQNLTLRTFNISDVEFIYNFYFIVDRTAPVFDSSYLDYNNQRFLKSAVFSFYVTDNYISNTSLIVQYSIDGKIFKPFDIRFLFPLLSYSDGLHTLEVKARDFAGNSANFLISFTIDTTKPTIVSITIPEMIEDLEHNKNFVPANVVINTIITDSDPGLRTFYRWNNGPYIEFSGSFILTSTDKEAVLRIYANDTLGNGEWYNIQLVYDSSAPVVNLEWPTLLSKINDRTWLDFNVQDFFEHSIQTVEYEWDIGGPEEVSPNIYGDFSFALADWIIVLYESFLKSFKANLTITAEDILGNIDSYYFSFEIDIYAPVLALYYTDELSTDTALVDDSIYQFQGGSELWYNNSENDDLASFVYSWDGNSEYTALLDPWNFTIPTEDGDHTLHVILSDITGSGDGISQNILEANFTFVVDDIHVDYLDPTDLDSNNHFNLVYNDTLQYTVNVTDEVDRQPIDGLQYAIHYDTSYNLNITVIQLDNSTYEVIIHALDVTNGLETDVTIQFYKSYPLGGQFIPIHLIIDKKEADLSILAKSDTTVMYGENFQIYITLQNEWLEFQEINKIIVDGTIEIYDFYVNLSTMECRFNLSSTEFLIKGNYSIAILAESLYYFGNTSSETLFDIEIRPIPVFLDLWVSNSTILEGSSVTIYANLTTFDGTPIANAQIYFIIYIYLKNESVSVPIAIRLAFTDYNGTDDSESRPTLSNGIAILSYELNSSISSIEIEAEYRGDETRDQIKIRFNGIVITFPPPEAEKLPSWLLGLIIGGSILVAGIISFIVYKVTRPKAFEELMKKITDEDIALNYSIMSPGVVLSIFDQRKGPIPLVSDHSLNIARYLGRMQIGIDNFLLKICDQAYSSLGFEEHSEERRTGSIRLPSERMIAMTYGIQLENKTARGGFENLSLITLADNEYGVLLLSNQEYLFDEIDELISKLKSKKPLNEIQEILSAIRRKSVIIILAAQLAEKQQDNL